MKSLEEKFFKEVLTEEQQRQFGCVVMTVANLYERSAISDTLQKFLNTDFSISDLVTKLTDANKREYQRWNLYIRSLAEGQAKVNEMSRRKFGLKDNLSPFIQKYMSSKHDLALAMGIDSGKDYDEGAFNQAIKWSRIVFADDNKLYSFAPFSR